MSYLREFLNWRNVLAERNMYSSMYIIYLLLLLLFKVIAKCLKKNLMRQMENIL